MSRKTILASLDRPSLIILYYYSKRSFRVWSKVPEETGSIRELARKGLVLYYKWYKTIATNLRNFKISMILFSILIRTDFPILMKTKLSKIEYCYPRMKTLLLQRRQRHLFAHWFLIFKLGSPRAIFGKTLLLTGRWFFERFLMVCNYFLDLFNYLALTENYIRKQNKDRMNEWMLI